MWGLPHTRWPLALWPCAVLRGRAFTTRATHTALHHVLLVESATLVPRSDAILVAINLHRKQAAGIVRMSHFVVYFRSSRSRFRTD